jgi:2-enoate reductase
MIATGSVPKALHVGECETGSITHASDVLSGLVPVGQEVVIIGGGQVGCETALWLAQQGKDVTIVEALNDILSAGNEMAVANEMMLRDLLAFHHVHIKTGVMLVSVSTHDIVIESEKGRDTIHGDSVITAIGFESRRELYDEIRHCPFDTYVLGDAKKVQNIMSAIWDAYEVARSI